MGVKAFTKAAVSDLKGKLQRGLLRSLKYFRKIDHCQGGEANTGRSSGLRRQRHAELTLARIPEGVELGRERVPPALVCQRVRQCTRIDHPLQDEDLTQRAAHLALEGIRPG